MTVNINFYRRKSLFRINWYNFTLVTNRHVQAIVVFLFASENHSSCICKFCGKCQSTVIQSNTGNYMPYPSLHVILFYYFDHYSLKSVNAIIFYFLLELVDQLTYMSLHENGDIWKMKFWYVSWFWTKIWKHNYFLDWSNLV